MIKFETLFRESFFLCLNSNMDDRKAAKILIKRSKKNPILYSHAEILYAKRIKKNAKSK